MKEIIVAIQKRILQDILQNANLQMLSNFIKNKNESQF